jgi:hypothetical protein
MCHPAEVRFRLLCNPIYGFCMFNVITACPRRRRACIEWLGATRRNSNMKTLRTQIILTMALGALALLAGWFSHLALTDIYHGEADVALEWRIIQVSAAVILLFVGSALVTLGRTLKHVA